MRNLSQTLSRSLPWIGPALLILWRTPNAFFRAELWAEDGTEFFQTAFAGISSLWTPVWGYHFLWCRIIAFAATAFPVVTIPYFYSAACLLTTAFTLGYFSREGFSWFIESRWKRIFLCLMFAGMPGSAEVYLNLCNLHSVLTLLAVLLLLEKPWTLSGKRFAFLVFLALSAGQLILLVPLLAALFYLTRNRRYLTLAISFLPIFILNFIGNHIRVGATGDLKYVNLLLAPRLMAENFFDRFIYGPLLGNSMAEAFMRLSNFIYWPVSAAVGWGLWRMVKHFRVGREVLILCSAVTVSALGTYGMIAIARSGATWVIGHSSGDLTWDSRYSYFTGFLSTLFWCSIFFKIALSKKPALRAAGYGFVILMAYSNFSHWRHADPRPDLHWPEQAVQVQEVLDLRNRGQLKEPVTLPIRLHPQNPDWAVRKITISDCALIHPQLLSS